MWRVGTLAILTVLLASCTRTRTHDSVTAAATAQPVAWLCRPDREGDPCASADLTATELVADGTRVVVPHRPVASTDVDCFYVYPTVDLQLVPGNHEDLHDTRQALGATLAQAARFTEACTLWVPLYRQVTIGTYLQPKPVLERGLALAFSDVERAFAEYLAQATPARRIVLVGHSQGAEMVVRLLRRFFDHDPVMRARLLLALPIGGDFEVPVGATRGGTLETIPACTRARETGCVVAYRTYADGEKVDPDRWAPSAGHESVCVDPAALDRDAGAPHRLSRAYFQLRPELRGFMKGVADVTTPFVMLRDFYGARCVRQEGGYAYLEASSSRVQGDVRESPIDLHARRLRFGKLGLHVLDMQLAQGDLVDLVALRARPR